MQRSQLQGGGLGCLGVFPLSQSTAGAPRLRWWQLIVSSHLHLGFDPQSWIKKQKPQAPDPKCSQELPLQQQLGWVGALQGSWVPETLTLFARHRAVLCALAPWAPLSSSWCSRVP